MTTYLCGGINGLSDGAAKDWREVAKAQLAGTTLDPMRRDYRGKEDDSVAEIVQGDLEDIQASDYILVNATRPSWGTAMEIVYAHKLGKPIVAFVSDGSQQLDSSFRPVPPKPVSPWLRFHCTVVAKLSEAITIINKSTL